MGHMVYWGTEDMHTKFATGQPIVDKGDTLFLHGPSDFKLDVALLDPQASALPTPSKRKGKIASIVGKSTDKENVYGLLDTAITSPHIFKAKRPMQKLKSTVKRAYFHVLTCHQHRLNSQQSTRDQKTLSWMDT